MRLSGDLILNAIFNASKTAQGMTPAIHKAIELILHCGRIDEDHNSNLIYADIDRSIAPVTSQFYPLADGDLVDVFGDPAVFARVHAMLLVNSSDEIGSGAQISQQNGKWFTSDTDKLKVRAKGYAYIAAPDVTGYPVVLTDADVLDVTNLSGSESARFSIFIIGSSV